MWSDGFTNCFAGQYPPEIGEAADLKRCILRQNDASDDDRIIFDVLNIGVSDLFLSMHLPN